jgi:hypothetical protein
VAECIEQLAVSLETSASHASVHGSLAFADYAALFFDPGGRPGPRRRLRRRRPVLARFGVEKLPSNDWIAERTSCCTRSRITVNKLFCLGIVSPFSAADIRMPDHQQREVYEPASGESCWLWMSVNASTVATAKDDMGNTSTSRRDPRGAEQLDPPEQQGTTCCCAKAEKFSVRDAGR